MLWQTAAQGQGMGWAGGPGRPVRRVGWSVAAGFVGPTHVDRHLCKLGEVYVQLV